MLLTQEIVDSIANELEKRDKEIKWLNEVIIKKNKQTVKIHNLFFKALNLNISKYSSGYHVEGCQANKDWRIIQACDCIVGDLINLMNLY